MTRTMYDALSTNLGDIPPNPEIVAGYIDAGPNPAAPPMTPEDWALFPGAIHVGIATQAATNDGLVLDVERGDATPDQAPGWSTMRRFAGVDPTVYCSADAVAGVLAAFDTFGVAHPMLWVAAWNGDPSIPAGAVAHQYLSLPGYDVSSCVDSWPPSSGGTVAASDLAYVNRAGGPDVYVFDKVAVRHVLPTEWAAVMFATSGEPNGPGHPPVIALPADWFDSLPVFVPGPVGAPTSSGLRHGTWEETP